MVNIIEFWEVWDDYCIDGKDTNIRVIARFSNRRTAETYARGDGLKTGKGRGNYGHPAKVRRITFVVADEIDEMPLVKKEEEKQKTLAKLTDEEREELGL